MADTFREAGQELAPAGLFLRDRVSQALLAALGGMVADTTALVREGVLQRFARTADETALVEIGETRQMERAPGESAEDYQHRLAAPIDWHSARGAKQGLVEVFGPLGVELSKVVVWDDHEDTILPATPPDIQWWSRCMIVVDMSGGPWSAPVWSDSAVWSDSEVWGIEGATQLDIAYLRRTIRKNKWTGAYPLALVLIFDTTTYDLSATWSASYAWVGDPAVAVMPLGRAWGWNETVYAAPDDQWSDSEVWADAFTF
jgi:hypothetical protein